VILVALLLGALGVADLARTRLRGTRTAWVPAALGILAFGVGSFGTGQAWWWVPAAAAAVVAWVLSTREPANASALLGRRAPGQRAGYWAVGGLAVTIAAAFAWGSALPTASGFLVDWYSALPYPGLRGVGFVTFALTACLVVFLVESANVVVRLALRGERSSDPASPVAAASSATSTRRSVRWWRRPRTADAATDARSLVPAPLVEPEPLVELKGGRFIGPLERLFVLALLLTGQYTALAAVIAAKGIVRFPEISRDAAGGSKAEYFLVGSFASWALVMIAALLIGLGVGA